MSTLSRPEFHDEAKAYEFVERILWPNGPVCPRCHETKRVGKLAGKSTRPGVYKCYVCRKPFTVKIGTVFEASNLPMHKWLQAIYLMCSSKKGISSNQLARTLAIQVRSGWFLSMRIREAMRSGALDPLGGGGGIIEADETFTGRRHDRPVRRGYLHKHAVLTLVERNGAARSFHIDRATGETIVPIVRANVSKDAKVYTDDAGYYSFLRIGFAGHERVNHDRDEYARGEVHTNTVEGYFALFKRGMKGVYQHCSEKHLHRYLAEFDFRYTNRVRLGIDDKQRTEKALRGVAGKRLTYRKVDATA
jgi:transposase-like protein